MHRVLVPSSHYSIALCFYPLIVLLIVFYDIVSSILRFVIIPSDRFLVFVLSSHRSTVSLRRFVQISSYRFLVFVLSSYRSTMLSFYHLVSLSFRFYRVVLSFRCLVGFYHFLVSVWRWWGYHADRAVPSAPASVHTEAQPQDSSGERRKLCLRQLQGLSSKTWVSSTFTRSSGRGEVVAPLGAPS